MGPFWSKFASAQNQHFSLYLPNSSLNFADILHRNLMVFFEKIEVYSPEKFIPFLAFFGPNLDLVGSNISVKLVFDLGLHLSIVIVYIFLASWNNFVMTLFFGFQI